MLRDEKLRQNEIIPFPSAFKSSRGREFFYVYGTGFAQTPIKFPFRFSPADGPTDDYDKRQTIFVLLLFISTALWIHHVAEVIGESLSSLRMINNSLLWVT